MFVCFINNVQQFSVVLTIVIAKTECYALAFQLNPFFYAQTIGFFIFYAQTIGFFNAQTIGFFIFLCANKRIFCMRKQQDFLCANNRIFYAQSIGFFMRKLKDFFFMRKQYDFLCANNRILLCANNSIFQTYAKSCKTNC